MAVGTTAAIVGGVGLAAGGAGLGMAMSKGPKAPKPRDLSTEAAETLEAQIAMAPDVFAATSSEEYGDPAYARLQMEMLREHAPALREMAREDLATQRAGDLEDLARFGPQVTAAWRAANPEAAAAIERQEAMLSRLQSEAMSELDRGGRLSPEEQRLADQSARSAWSARGRVRSSPAVSAEILNRYGLTRQRQMEAFQRAAGVAGMQGQAAVGAASVDPSLTILGRPSAVNTGQQQFQPGMAFDPFSPYAADLYNTNYNAQAAAGIAGANQRAAMASGLMGMGGSIIGGGLQGGYF